MYLLQVAVCFVVIGSVSLVTTATVKWFNQYSHVFQNMIYSERQIMKLKYSTDEMHSYNHYYYPLGKITKSKTFWTKLSPAPKCSVEHQRWLNITRFKRAQCSTCCPTKFSATAPVKIEYKGKTYNVHKPAGGWQILFLGKCPARATCNFGQCQPEHDYHTWILIKDPEINSEPKIRFVPVSYPRFCKCVNSS